MKANKNMKKAELIDLAKKLGIATDGMTNAKLIAAINAADQQAEEKPVEKQVEEKPVEEKPVDPQTTEEKPAEDTSTKPTKQARKRTKKLSQKDMHSNNMAEQVYILLNNIENTRTVAPHGQDGFTVKDGRKKLFEVYKVPTGYTMWVTDDFAPAINMPVAQNRRCGASVEYKLTLEQVINVLIPLCTYGR